MHRASNDKHKTSHHNEMMQRVVLRVTVIDTDCSQCEAIATRSTANHNGWLQQAGRRIRPIRQRCAFMTGGRATWNVSR